MCCSYYLSFSFFLFPVAQKISFMLLCIFQCWYCQYSWLFTDIVLHTWSIRFSRHICPQLVISANVDRRLSHQISSLKLMALVIGVMKDMLMTLVIRHCQPQQPDHCAFIGQGYALVWCWCWFVPGPTPVMSSSCMRRTCGFQTFRYDGCIIA